MTSATPVRRDDRARPAFRTIQHGQQHVPARLHLGGHPVASAVALANLDLRVRGVLEHVRSHEGDLRATLEKLLDLPIVGDARRRLLYGIELVKDKTTKETFDADDSERLLRGFPVRPCSTLDCTAAPTTAETLSSRSRRR